MSATHSGDAFTIDRHGDVLVIGASSALEMMDPTLIDSAAALLLEPLRDLKEPLLVFDLSRLDYFGSSFLALLIRSWKTAKVKGGTMALAGVSGRARELLRITKLDIVWPMYANRQEAVAALSAD